MGDKYATLRRAQLHLDFIHANSTTHSFLFGALAELLDNARPKTLLWITEEASDIIYFGTSKKRLSTLKFIGQYGNGLKSGSMRIGKDFILFTKKEETMTCVFFSQTFCEGEGLSEVVVPMPSWLTKNREPVTDDPQKFSTELSIIYKYSPYKTEAELMRQFDIIYGKCGTLLVIYNLKLLLSGEPELDVKTDKEDILMAEALEDFPERWSFRAYTSVLYFDPWMRIFIQAKKVKTKHLCHCLYKPRKYLYVTSSFKGAFKNEVKKAEEAVKIAELVLKDARIRVNQPDRTSLSSPAKDILQKALEDVETKHKILKEKRRELKTARTLSLFFGVNTENRNHAGMFIYSNNRLIKMHEKVGPQLKLKSLLGAGVIGIVNIPLEVMEPSHNKQEFLNVQEYNHLLRVMGQFLVQYCKDTGISNRNLTLFWNEFGYQNNKDTERSLESIQYQRRQAMAIPFIIQCDLCLKWRVLPPSTDYQEKELLDAWICANNPNLSENSCHQAERLPPIPLGTMSTVSLSKNEKEKRLQESVRRYQDQLAEQQLELQFIPKSRIAESTTICRISASKENTKPQKIRPSGYDLKHESLASFELPAAQRSWKSNTEGTDSDVEFVSETKVMKSTRKKAEPQQRHPAALPEKVRLTERSQASSWEMKRKENQNLVQECQGLIEVETSNSDQDTILILDQSDNNVFLKREKKEVPLMKKEKQELCSDIAEIKRNSSLPNWKSIPVQDFGPGSGHRARVAVSSGCEVGSLLTKSSQSPSVKETVRKLTSNLWEIILHFFPEYQLPSEIGYSSVEEFVASSELEQCTEQTNRKLKMCFQQIQDVYMAQYAKKLKRTTQSIIYDANRRGVMNEISLVQCEQKRKVTEDRLNNLRVKLAALLQKLQLGGPVGDMEQIDSYLEALLKEDHLFGNAFNKGSTDAGHSLPLENNESTSQN
ncbi:MORC family CW-type zinc finger protein 1 [Myotis myotis]|uniref:MORC family CW-type zinc finger protein 1 n=1 Tax=Myotis myotis TaxID=51298 RepID=UPI00174AF027|nr:MORC family CW-type zinc finger protein 1 [Myotis myotis]